MPAVPWRLYSSDSNTRDRLQLNCESQAEACDQLLNLFAFTLNRWLSDVSLWRVNRSILIRLLDGL